MERAIYAHSEKSPAKKDDASFFREGDWGGVDHVSH